MTTTFNSNRAWFLLLAILLKGCAVSEVWSSGTEGMASGQLGQLRVEAHHDRLVDNGYSPVHIRAVIIDGVLRELECGETVFWVKPGEHDVEAEYEDCVHWPKTWFRSRQKAFVNGSGSSFKAEAGQSYQLGCAVGINSGPWVTLTFMKVAQ